MSLLSEIRLGTGKNDYWTGIRTTNIPAVMAAAAAASGANLKLTEAFNLEVLSTGIISATAKSNHAGEIAGMTKLYAKIGGFQPTPPTGFGLGLQRLRSGVSSQLVEHENTAFGGILISKYVSLLQQFVNESEKGGEIDKSSFRETCSQATALLLSNLVSKHFPDIEFVWLVCSVFSTTHNYGSVISRMMMQNLTSKAFHNFYGFYAGAQLTFPPPM